MKKLIVAAIFLGFCQSANALFIDHGTYLTDTDSGLDWLDVTASQGRLYDDVSSQFGTGGDFQGYRFATGLEFEALLFNWTGVPLIKPYPYSPVEYTEGADTIDKLVQVLGNTNTDNPHNLPSEINFTFGFISDPSGWGPDERVVAALLDWHESDPAALDLSAAHYDSLYKTSDNPLVGSFLVRATVPEPASIALMGLGLVGLGFSRRRKSKGLKA